MDKKLFIAHGIREGKKKLSPRRCVGKFCAQHNYQHKQGMKSAMPYHRCGKSVQVDYRLCRNCGGDSLRHVLKRKEIKAAKNFKLVLEQIKKLKIIIRKNIIPI